MKSENYTKKDANLLWEKGFGLIDTSGRTRNPEEGSTIALSSKKLDYTIRFEAKVKKTIFRNYLKKYPEERFKAIIHCIGLFYCLKDSIDKMPGVFICADGFNIGLIKHYLKDFLKEKYNDEKIVIYSSLSKIFGKKNKADKLARKTNKGDFRPTKIIKISEIERFLKK